MPPVEINSISVTRKGPPPKTKGVALHSIAKVRSVGEDYGGKHVRVELVHGRKAKPKKGKGAQPTYFGDERPTSSLSISKEHAKHFPVGGRVRVSMMPMADDGDDSD